MFGEMGFGQYMRMYIERRYYLRPLITGLIVGMASATFFGYYLYLAVKPGILGTIALIFLSIVFGMVAAAVSAFLFFYVQLYRMARMAEDVCSSCGNRLPKDAAFCPFCGNRT